MNTIILLTAAAVAIPFGAWRSENSYIQIKAHRAYCAKLWRTPYGPTLSLIIVALASLICASAAYAIIHDLTHNPGLATTTFTTTLILRWLISGLIGHTWAQPTIDDLTRGNSGQGQKSEAPRTRSAPSNTVPAADNPSPPTSAAKPPSIALSAQTNTGPPVQPATHPTTTTHSSAPTADGPSHTHSTLPHSPTSPNPEPQTLNPEPFPTYILPCPRCNHMLAIPRTHFLKFGRCNHCGHRFKVEPNRTHYHNLAFPLFGSRTAAYIPLIPFALALVTGLWALERALDQPEPAAMTPEQLEEIDQFLEEDFPDDPDTCYLSTGAYYHRPHCIRLNPNTPQFPTDIYSAYESGYDPCPKCKPLIPNYAQ